MSEEGQTRKLTLSYGRVITVYSVPQRVYSRIMQKHPYPPVPVTIIPGDQTATGEEVRLARTKDPEYNRQCDEIDQLRMAEWSEKQILWGLRDENPPDDWEAPADLMQYDDPDWKPRTGEMGRKLDWIELELLAPSGDLTRVINLINELAGVDEELADAIEDTFPDSMDGETA